MPCFRHGVYCTSPAQLVRLVSQPVCSLPHEQFKQPRLLQAAVIRTCGILRAALAAMHRAVLPARCLLHKSSLYSCFSGTCVFASDYSSAYAEKQALSLSRTQNGMPGLPAVASRSLPNRNPQRPQIASRFLHLELLPLVLMFRPCCPNRCVARAFS